MEHNLSTIFCLRDSEHAAPSAPVLSAIPPRHLWSHPTHRRRFFASFMSILFALLLALPVLPIQAASPATNIEAGNAQQGCAQGKPAALSLPITAGTSAGSTRPALSEVALTFDDGPYGQNTVEILNILEANHVPATFFAEGQFMRRFPTLIRREWQDGDAIGLHTWNHPYMTTLADAPLKRQFRDTINAFHDDVGAQACLWLWRPPYGNYDQRVLAAAQSFGLSTVMWSAFGEDSRAYASVQHIISLIMLEVGPSGIVLLHDGPRNFPEQTSNALPLLIARLQAKGYSFVTVPQLLADEGFPGVSTGHISAAPPPPPFIPTPTIPPPPAKRPGATG